MIMIVGLLNLIRYNLVYKYLLGGDFEINISDFFPVNPIDNITNRINAFLTIYLPANGSNYRESFRKMINLLSLTTWSLNLGILVIAIYLRATGK